MAAWQKVDPSLLSIVDINRDGIVQLAEIAIGGDIIVLATPEIAGLPYVISGLVAAGGLAAALSTADGLLLTIANALSHDFYYKMLDPNASTARRVTISKILLLVVALIAAYGGGAEAGGHPVPGVGGVLARGGGVLPGAGARHLLEAGQQVGRDARHGRRPRHHVLLHGDDAAVAAQRVRRDRLDRRSTSWWGIQPISAGLWGVPLGFAVIIIVSLLTPAPDRETQELVEHVRYPNLTGDTMVTARHLSTSGRFRSERGPQRCGLLFLQHAHRAGRGTDEHGHERQEHDRNGHELSLCPARHVEHPPRAAPEEKQRVAQPDQADDHHHRQEQRRAGEQHRDRAVGRDLERREIVARGAEHRRDEGKDAGEQQDRADDRKVGRRPGR